jgi:bacillithiol system protein YtxJ
MEDKGIFEKKGRFIIYKHSPICSLSVGTKKNVIKYLEEEGSLEVITVDVIQDSELKNLVADKYNIEHKSPQILVMEDQKCVDTFSHTDITLKRLENINKF